MRDFVLKQNIKRFKGLLQTENDPDRRRIIEDLLQKATVDLRALERGPSAPKPLLD